MPAFLTRRAALGLIGAAAVAPSAVRASGAVKIVATTSMLADMARAVGGGRVSVKGLMGSGVDPHGYRQTRTDIVAAARADLVLWNGLYLEAQMEDFLLDLGRRKPVLAVAETLPREMLRSHDTYENKFDPHVWMAPALWSRLTDPVRDALAEIDPDGAAEFEEGAAAYRARLMSLADYAASVLATVPQNARLLVTAHDAFGYFGDAYGFEVAGIQGISTESEAGLARVEGLVDLLVERDVRAVFVESSVSERNVLALVEGAAARGHEVRVGAELFSDAMGAPGTYEGTYPGMIDHNVTAIARALGGAAPAAGMSGALRAGL